MPARPVAVHQLTPTLSWGDAVGNLVRLLHRRFAARGAGGTVFAARTDELSRGEARDPDELPRVVARGDLVLVHHSIQSRFVPLLRRTAQKGARIVVVFHNVTPPGIVAPYDPPLARACEAGLVELRELGGFADRALAFSEFSTTELREARYRDVRVVPFPVDFAAFDVMPEPTLLSELSDGCRNVLFVGRGAPNKRVEQVLRVFTAYQRLFDPQSRLVIAGGLDREQPYGMWVHAVRATLKPERVHLLGRVSDAQLSACFATAHVYLSMSSHEGFGVPLVEAMHRGVPVVAYAAGAVPETLGGAGWVCRRDDPVVFAKLLEALRRLSPEDRTRMTDAGRVRARTFDAATAFEPFARAVLDDVVHAGFARGA